MRRVLYGGFVCLILVAAVAFSRQTGDSQHTSSALSVEQEKRNPWTHLRLNNDPAGFQFVIISDRTGGHREKVFSRAVEQINLLQPEFVLSVGDLIEGYTTDKDKLAGEWKEFQSFAAKLDMPFFYVPGNHDLSNTFQDKAWEEKFGRRYYHFVYKDVLFLNLCSEDPPGSSKISEAQLAYVKKTLADNANVRWTIVSLHKPIWTDNTDKNGWSAVESLLAGRNYTVFAGHVHRYQKFVRQGMNYYQLATTGGGSRLRGVKYGEFDHVVWVTMKKNGPVLANIMLDGILPENLQVPETVEPVKEYDRKPTQIVKGYIYQEGVPVVGATVSFYQKIPATKSFKMVGDAVTAGDGSFQVSTYGAFDGLPTGDYAVTVAADGRYDLDGKKPTNLAIPQKYTKNNTTDLSAVVKTGVNEFTFDLARSEVKIEKR
jgi:hypothetical protein